MTATNKKQNASGKPLSELVKEANVIKRDAQKDLSAWKKAYGKRESNIVIPPPSGSFGPQR